MTIGQNAAATFPKYGYRFAGSFPETSAVVLSRVAVSDRELKAEYLVRDILYEYKHTHVDLD